VSDDGAIFAVLEQLHDREMKIEQLERKLKASKVDLEKTKK
jgi:hypothetical protein